jgi:large subunit ribosomal protein L25
MSSDTITLEVTKREQLGKGVKHLRNAGFVPANIYERGQASQAVTAPFVALTKVFQKAGKHHPVEVVLDGKKHLAMIKDVDFDPVKGLIRHVAFHAINKNETVEAEIPLRLTGEIPAEKASLMVLQQLDILEVEALPGDLVDAIEVDASTLAEVGDRLTVADVKAPNGITIKTEPEHVIAIVEEPKDQIAAAAAEAEAADAAGVASDHGSVDADESSDTPAQA